MPLVSVGRDREHETSVFGMAAAEDKGEELLVRGAREADIDRLLEIHTSAYPDPRSLEVRRRNFLHNPLGAFGDLRVAEVAGKIVAHAFLFPLEVGIGGRSVKTGAIASVGVAPEARGRGLASRLLDRLHLDSFERGDAITLLFAFRQGFYARYGYAPTTPSRRLALSPHAIPRAWSTHDGLVVRAADGADREGIEAMYARAATRQTGWITRPSTLWDTRLLDERRRFFVVARGHSVVGYISWTLSQHGAHEATTLVVGDLVAVDEEPRRALWGLLGQQRAQVHQIHVNVDAHDPIDRALIDADLGTFGTPEIEHAMGTICAGPMVRMTDIPRALAARGYANDATLELDVSGERFHLEVRAGSAVVGPSRATVAIVTDRVALTAIAYGALSPSDAARLGWLNAPDAGTLRAADALFALPPYFAIDPF
jgi:predicted acetyltransferase